jgi:ADP-heptose:LPS heptosyltransferase
MLARLESLLGRMPERIVVFRALVLGDMLCMIPAIRALQTALPHAKITLVSLPWAAELVARFPQYFADFIEFPGHPQLPEREFDAQRFPAFLNQVRQRGFDLALQMHGSGSIVNPLVLSFGARRTAGFCESAEECPDAETFLTYPTREHEVWRHLRLMQFLGVPLCGDELEFPVTTDDRAQLAELWEAQDLSHGPYVCLHPGARYLSRRWPTERFAAVGDALASEGYTVVITGSAAEADLAASVSQSMTRPHVNLAGQTTLGTMAALLQQTRLLICNDTGVSHLAAALRVPSVVIVTGSDPRRWAPLDRRRHRVVMQAADCRPCEYRVCPIDFHCAHRISAQLVLETALESLADSGEPMLTRSA